MKNHAWMLSLAVLLGGCAGKWPQVPTAETLTDAWSSVWGEETASGGEEAASQTLDSNRFDSSGRFDSGSFDGSLATAMAARGIATTVTQPSAWDVKNPSRSPAARPALPAMAPPPPPPAVAARRTVAALPPQPAALQTRPLRQRRIVSIPLSVADDAHAQGLLRRAATLNGSYGGRIRLVPYGPDPQQAAGIAGTAAAELMRYGVAAQQLVISPALLANAREARIDVLFEY